jgi:hypothetical protein
VISAVVSGIAFLGLMVYVSLALKKAMARATQLHHETGSVAGEAEQEPLLADGAQIELE